MVIVDRDAAHDAVQRELSKPIYPRESIEQRFSDWLNDFIYRLVVKGSSMPGGWLTIGVLLTLIAVAVVIAVRIGRRTMRTRRGVDYQLFGAAEFSAAEHRASAERFAGEGNWAAAIRHRLRAVARQLEENGVLNQVPGRTANELARDAGQSVPGLRSELARAAMSFNDVAYGERPGTEAAYRTIADLDEQLGSGRRAPAPAVSSETASGSWAQVQ
ncbi:MAG: hypothetical protein JWR32_552 [Mycobacterium sp.]|jgi:hypothetical protein|nr:hypothetical protein [Mycobacterium sp.]